MHMHNPLVTWKSIDCNTMSISLEYKQYPKDHCKLSIPSMQAESTCVHSVQIQFPTNRECGFDSAKMYHSCLRFFFLFRAFSRPKKKFPPMERELQHLIPDSCDLFLQTQLFGDS